MNLPRLHLYFLAFLLAALSFCCSDETGVNPDSSAGVITSPDSSSVWTAGQKNAIIRWNKEIFNTKVGINLYLNGHIVLNITRETENLGKYYVDSLPASLSAGSRYLIQVYSVKNADIQAISQFFSIKKNSPPGQIEGAKPENGARIAGIFVRFVWYFVDPDGDPLTYDFYFGTDPNPPLVRKNRAELENNMVYTDLDTNRTYWWRIVARDKYNNETSSPVMTFISGHRLAPGGGGSAYYKFDNNCLDASGNGNHANPVNEPVYTSDRFGNPNSAIQLMNKQYIIAANGGQPNSPVNFTQAAWVKTSRTQQMVIATRRNLSSASWITFRINKGKAGLVIDKPGEIKYCDGTTTVNDDKWHFVVGVKNGSKYSIYVDGKLENTITGASTISADDLEMHIGHSGAWEVHWDNFFYGSLDDIRFFNQVLTAAQIDSLYHERGWQGN